MSIKGTRTEANLLTTFAGESQARNRYTYFSKKARKEGFVQISDIFLETAEQELQHAKRFFSFLEGGEAQVSYMFPAGVIGDTYDNLIASAAGERHENTTMYPEFAEIAREEGFKDVALAYQNIIKAEQFHEERYMTLAENIKNERCFSRAEPLEWRCLKCGFVHSAKTPPATCPACLHPKEYFEICPRNW